MKHIGPHCRFLLLTIGWLSTALSGTAQTLEEAYTLLGPGVEVASATVDPAGNLYLFGRLNGTVNFDLKGGQFPLTSDGIDLFLAKYNAEGNRQYARRIRVDLPEGRSTGPGEIAADAEGNVYVCGAYRGTIFFEEGGNVASATSNEDRANGYVAKYDAAGNNVFYRTFFDQGAPARNNIVTNVALTSDGHFYLLGRFQGTLDFNPSSAEEELITNQGNASDLFLSKYTTAGDYVKTSILGGIDYEAARRLMVDQANNAIIAGHFKNRIRLNPGRPIDTFVRENTRSFFVARYTPDLALLDAIPLYRSVDTADQAIEGRIRLSIDAAQNIYVATPFRGSVEVGDNVFSTAVGEEEDILVVKYSANRELIFARQYGGPGYEENRELVVDDAGNIYLSGIFSGTLDLDASTTEDNRTSAGEEDGFLVTLTPQGDVRSLAHFSSRRGVFVKEVVRFGETVYVAIDFNEQVQIDDQVTITGNPFDEERRDALVVKYTLAAPAPSPDVALTGLSRYTGPVGSEVILQGNNLGETVADNIITFGETTAEVSRVNEARTEVTVRVPDVAAGSYLVALRTADTTLVADRPFLVVDPATDTAPPTIEVSVPALLNEEQETFAVSSQVSDTSGVASVIIEFLPIRKNPLGDDWRRINGSQEGSSSTYVAQLTDTDLDELGVQTRVVATDALGNSDTSDIQYTFRQYTEAEPLRLERLSPAGEVPSATDYNLVSIPLTDQRTSEALDALGPYDTQRWRAWRLAESGQEDTPYQELGQGWDGQLQLGQGYLLIYTDPTTFQTTGRVVEATYDQPFALTLAPGFTLIGNPYPFALEWTEVMAYNNLAPDALRLKTFDKGFREADRLEAFQGGLVVNPNEGQSLTLALPVNNVTGIGGRSTGREGSPVRTTDSDADWQVTLRAQGGGMNATARLGMHPAAQWEEDAHDDFTPPRLTDYLELSSEHADFFLPRFSRDMVPPVAQHQWEWQIASSVPNQEVVLRWDLNETNKRTSLWLVDPHQRRTVDMRRQNQYTVRTDGAGRRKVSIAYGKEPEALEGAISLGAGSVFPNPVRQVLHLPVVLPPGAPRTLTLEILTVTGQVIGQQEYALPRSGYHTLRWYRPAARGGMVPGLYFYRLRGATTVTGRFALE